MAEDNTGAPKNRGRAFGRALLGVFVNTGDDAVPSEGPPEEPQEDFTVMLSAGTGPHVGTVTLPADTASDQPSAASIADADFPTIYTQLVADGDPNMDAVFGAFEGMDGMPEDQRRTAVAAMVKAMRADADAIAQTTQRRLKAVRHVVGHVKGEMEKARQQRAETLKTFEAGTRQKDEALQQQLHDIEAQIVALRAELGTETKRVNDANAEAQGKQLAHEQRARAEETRLGRFNEFLRSLGAGAGKTTEKK